MKEGVRMVFSAIALFISKPLLGLFGVLLGVIALSAIISYRTFGSFSAVTPSALLIAPTIGTGALSGVLYAISKYLTRD